MEKDTEKPLAALIIAQSKRSKGGGDSSGDSSSGEMAAMEDIAAARDKGDLQAEADALKAFIRICMRKYGGTPSYEE